MSIHIFNKQNVNDPSAEATLHSLPCKIHADCDAPVDKYFVPYITFDEEGDLQSSFRGHKLNGSKFKLPENYKGIILHETKKPMTTKQERKFYITKNFDHFTYWNWDKKTSKNDVIVQAMDWVDIAEALHSPIMEE